MGEIMADAERDIRSVPRSNTERRGDCLPKGRSGDGCAPGPETNLDRVRKTVSEKTRSREGKPPQAARVLIEPRDRNGSVDDVVDLSGRNTPSGADEVFLIRGRGQITQIVAPREGARAPRVDRLPCGPPHSAPR